MKEVDEFFEEEEEKRKEGKVRMIVLAEIFVEPRIQVHGENETSVGLLATRDQFESYIKDKHKRDVKVVHVLSYETVDWMFKSAQRLREIKEKWKEIKYKKSEIDYILSQ